MLVDQQKKLDEEIREYGHSRPMVTIKHQGYRFIAVHNRLEFSKNWKTPIDFFGYYIKVVMDGAEWGNAEIKKPLEDRHPILQWYNDVCTWQRQHTEKHENGLFSGIATGSVKAYYALAYDLWTLDNHAILQKKLVRRLKNKDQFQGARYELYVIASMIRAGFIVQLEDETDPTRTHYELVATHKTTGRKISVEAKSTGRPGVLGKGGDQAADEEIQAKIYRKLQEALLQEADYDRVIFVDVNMPPHEGGSLRAPWLFEVADQLGRLESTQSPSDPYPPAFLFFTNHPYHYVGNDEPEPSQTCIFTGFNRPELKPIQGDEGETALLALTAQFKKSHPEIDQLVDSVFNHTRIPTLFAD